MSKTYNAVFCQSASMDLNSKLGFTTSKVSDTTIKRNIGSAAKHAAAGTLKAIPASWTVEQTRAAVPVIWGQAVPANTPFWYHVVPTFMALKEDLEGQDREGSATGFVAPGMSAPASGTPDLTS